MQIIVVFSLYSKNNYRYFENFEYQTIKTEEKFREKLKELLPKDNKKIYLLFNEIQVVGG